MKHILSIILLAMFFVSSMAETVNIVLPQTKNNRVEYAAEYLQKQLQKLGYDIVVTTGRREKKAAHHVTLSLATDNAGKKEGFTINTTIKGKKKPHAYTEVIGNDGTGCIYGCDELAAQLRNKSFTQLPATISDAPEMVLRGGCIGVQKPYLLPGRQVYEYPYTPELFPWFYDKQQWIEYLDMLVANRMNSVYLWNGHPFASLVKLADYPFAVEVDDATFEKNKEIFAFLTNEADRRGIFVIQMFYNILVSKPFAEHYGIKTQDRHRPITPLLHDYTYKSVKAFIENYPNVGLLVCLGEAMDTYEDDVEWMTKTIIPAVKDGLKSLGRTDEPPVLLRAHDTNCEMVMQASLPLYKNLYTMNKYNGESLTTYTPQGPWGETHRALAALGSTHISNVHILANLEPWRWSSPDFIQKTVNAMHNAHHANALHLYPQASYWDWPYTADSINNGTTNRLKQLDRDWMWFAAWGRYAWNCHRDRTDETVYWNDTLASVYGTTAENAALIRTALEESGEIAPKLLRRFGITEGNRQTLLLGMFCSQIVNPYKYTVYPGFYESCGPDGEKLIEYVAKEHNAPLPVNQNFPTNVNTKAAATREHIGELPLDIIQQCIEHGEKAVLAIDKAAAGVSRKTDEFARLRNDIHCYKEFAYAFALKVKACQHVLNYKYTQDISELDAAVPLLEQSLAHYRTLTALTSATYRYANSMQTSMRRIPIGGDNGKMKHWTELLPCYEQELANLKKNIAMLKMPQPADKRKTVIKALRDAKVTALNINGKTPVAVKMKKGAKLFSDLDSLVTDYATELDGLTAYITASKEQRADGTAITLTVEKPVTVLIGYFRDDQRKYAQAPKLETDATASEYGQQEPCYTSALRIKGMPQLNIHPYNLTAGTHTLRLPKGFLVVAGITSDNITPRDAALAGADSAIDWLFY